MKVARLKNRRCRRLVACVESEVMKITSKHMTEWVQSSPCFLGCCAAEGLRQLHSGLIRKNKTKHKSQCHQKQSQESRNNTSPLFSCTSNQQHACDRGVHLTPPPPRSAHMPAHARAGSWQVNPVLIDATKWCLKKEDAPTAWTQHYSAKAHITYASVNLFDSARSWFFLILFRGVNFYRWTQITRV